MIYQNTTTYIDFDGIACGVYLLSVSNTFRASIVYIVVVGANKSPKVAVQELLTNSFYTVSVADNTKVAIESGEVISECVTVKIA